MLRTVLKALLVALPIAFAASAAVCGNQAWGPASFAQDSGYVGADFIQDDGGALVVACHMKSKVLSYFLIEPRANWKQGESVNLTTKADNVSQSGPSPAVVMSRTKLESIMRKATTSFAISDGVYARVFPAVNFREATAPVLQACGDFIKSADAQCAPGSKIYIDPRLVPQRPHISSEQYKAFMSNPFVSESERGAMRATWLDQNQPIQIPFGGGMVLISATDYCVQQYVGP